MDFEQQIAEAKRNIARFRTSRKMQWTIGIAVAAVLALGLITSNISLLTSRSSLIAEYQDFKARAIEQIDSMATELQAAKAELERAHRHADVLSAQNADLKQLAEQADSLMDDLTATYTELDEAQMRIKDLIARRNNLQAFNQAQAQRKTADEPSGLAQIEQ